MKHYPCEKCNTRHRPSRHHILPKVFFNGYGGICHLCVYCHREVERRIAKTEFIYSGSKSRRYKLHPEEYREILQGFLQERRLVCTVS